MVIDLAVICEHQVAELHRLRAVLYVDDAQTAMTETDIAVDEQTSVVRSSMMKDISHRCELTFIDLPARGWRECDSVDAAHRQCARQTRGRRVT